MTVATKQQNARIDGLFFCLPIFFFVYTLTVSGYSVGVEKEIEMNAKTEAIATADAHLDNCGLPTYTELLAALRLGYRHLNGGGDSLTPMEHDAAFKLHRDLLARAGGAV